MALKGSTRRDCEKPSIWPLEGSVLQASKQPQMVAFCEEEEGEEEEEKIGCLR